jgi:maleylacetoacetate isomerase
MKLYGYFRSSATYRVRIALNLKGLKVEHVAVHLTRDGGEQHKPEYRARNAQGLVPALELDDGTVLTQSLAIIEYLDAVRPEPRLIPTDPLAAAQVRAVALAIACDIHPLNNTRVLSYLKGPLGHSAEEVNAWYGHWILKGGLEAVERMIDGGQFCFGERPGLADVYLIPQVANARRYDISIDHLPKILKVDRTCSEIEAFRLAHPSLQPDAQ